MTSNRILLAVAPLVLSILGCGSAAAPPATTPPAEPAATSADTPASSAAADAPPAPDAAKPQGEKQSAEPSAPAAPKTAAVDDKPLGGAMTQNEIRAHVEKHGDFFNDCYTLGAGKSQQFVAKVTLKVTLGPSGSVSEALVTNSTAKNAKVDQCVVDGFKKIKFPAPKSGATSVFTFPMEFKGAVEVK